ncbi:MAG: indolepyruvate oxidoreductase subunit beta [Acidilobus sp.]
MKGRLNIVLVGVGGQGLITAARVLAEAAVNGGTKALVAETHGLSQRGGAVEVHVRIGNVYAPLVPQGEADLVVGFEMIEAARGMRYLDRDGVLITSDVIMRPPIPGLVTPRRAEIEKAFREAGIRYYVVPTREIAERAGSYLSENVALLGALMATGRLDGYIELARLKGRISELPLAAANLRAFEDAMSFCLTQCRPA